MKLLLLVIGLVISSETHSIPKNLENEWANFKLVFNKSYKSLEHEVARKRIFLENYLDILEHNAEFEKGLVTYEKGINQFSDMTYVEFANTVLMKEQDIPIVEDDSNYVEMNATAPLSFDWRDKGAVTPVKDQKSCGSCWAFAAVGALESAYKIKHNSQVLLSEQNLVDCDKVDNGCNGGNPINAYNYIINNNGIDTQSSYRYEAVRKSCRFNRNNVGAKVSKQVIPQRSENAIRDAVANVGPVSVLIYASSNFQAYKGGIFTDSLCRGSSINHAVLAVGYGSQGGQDFWIIKNSWNTWWGEQGYIRMKRGINLCNIQNHPDYPIVV